MSRGAQNIVLGRMGVRVMRKDEDVESIMVFNHFLWVSQGLLASIVAI